MPNPDEAREQAWRETVRALPAPPSRDDVVGATEAFWATLDEPPAIDAMNALIALSEIVARREVWKAQRDDQQRIAALVAVSKRALPVLVRLTRDSSEPGRGNSLTHNVYAELRAPLIDLIHELRALAGQSEEVKP